MGVAELIICIKSSLLTFWVLCASFILFRVFVQMQVAFHVILLQILSTLASVHAFPFGMDFHSHLPERMVHGFIDVTNIYCSLG